MGQLLRRIYNFVKVNVNSAASDPYSGEEEELKNIIEELNREKEKGNKENSNYKSQPDSTDNSDPNAMNFIKACKILGISQTAGIEEIKSAYKQKIKEYHPDRVANLGDELKELAGKKTQEINGAYNFLKIERKFQ